MPWTQSQRMTRLRMQLVTLVDTHLRPAAHVTENLLRNYDAIFACFAARHLFTLATSNKNFSLHLESLVPLLFLQTNQCLSGKEQGRRPEFRRREEASLTLERVKADRIKKAREMPRREPVQEEGPVRSQTSGAVRGWISLLANRLPPTIVGSESNQPLTTKSCERRQENRESGFGCQCVQ